MAIPILLPALSPTMETGTLASWNKAEGDRIEIGDVIAEIETDKATMEYEAVDEGVLGKILIEAGTEEVPVNKPIGILLEEGEKIEDVDIDALIGGASAGSKKAPEDDSKDKKSAEKPAEKADQKDSGAAQAEQPKKAASPPPPPPAARSDSAGTQTGQLAPPAPKVDGQRLRSSPLARRLAAEHDLDLTQIEGSGPNGRIIRADIEKALETGAGRKAAAGEGARPAAAPMAAEGVDAIAFAEASEIPFRTEKASNVRRTIAKRLLQAHQTVPVFYLTIDVRLDQLLGLRKRLNESGEVKISVNDFIIKAVATALARHPECNSAWAENEIVYFERVDVSMAVATEMGLITPIIREADRKGLAAIAAEARDLAGKAREGKLKPQDYQGGTFSISNLGMFGIRQFTAILNPPQSGIIAVGAGEERAVVENGEIGVANFTSLTMTCDHRTIDGAVGAIFLNTVRDLLEEPGRMLL